MFKLGQTLALFALLASTINAQCALTCSLQAKTPTSKSHYQVSGAAHACCPERHSSLPREQQEQPKPLCPDPAPVVNSAAEVTPLQEFVVSHWAVCISGCTSASAIAEFGTDRSAITLASCLPFSSAFAILRV